MCFHGLKCYHSRPTHTLAKLKHSNCWQLIIFFTSKAIWKTCNTRLYSNILYSLHLVSTMHIYVIEKEFIFYIDIIAPSLTAHFEQIFYLSFFLQVNGRTFSELPPEDLDALKKAITTAKSNCKYKVTFPHSPRIHPHPPLNN